ncbi:MAG: SDR family oxidoreductase [Chloroflexi bacterium]|nr:SDR family oxidoreductase [Chloroflexota bacterium]
MTTNATKRPRALVTGASSGIGTAFAERLAHDGYDLIIVARRRDRLESLAGQLQSSYSVHVEVLAADLSQSDGLRTVEKRAAEDSALELLVNNAGFGGYMPFVELDPDKAEELINLQVLAVTRLTRAVLPGMIARERGSIINVSSRLAFSGSMGSSQLPKRATYAGTKAFINTFTQLLQSELEGTGVHVQALCPGVVQTEFHEQVGIDSTRYPAGIVMEPEDVVQASLAGLKLGEVICIPAMEDPGLLTQIQESERRFFELTRSGSAAERYRS